MRALLSTGQRDRSRVVLTVLSGTLAAATVAGTGVATAAAAQETARSNADKARAEGCGRGAAAKAHHNALVEVGQGEPGRRDQARPKKTVIGKPTLVKASSSGSSRSVGSSRRRPSSSSPRRRARTKTRAARLRRPAAAPSTGS